MTDDCCDTTIDLHDTTDARRRVLITVLVINAATFALMVVGSIISRSGSVLASGLDNFGDAVTYALSLLVLTASSLAKARVALLKGILIALAAVGVALQIAWRLLHPEVPIFEAMGAFAVVNLALNTICLALLTPHRNHDVNLASAWECSRNDLYEGTAVLVAAGTVYVTDAAWPDLAVASLLLLLFARSATRVLQAALREIQQAKAAA